MPVQRIPRYSMLTRDLIKATHTGHYDYDHLISASKEIDFLVFFYLFFLKILLEFYFNLNFYSCFNHKQATAINEYVRKVESQAAFEKILERSGGFEQLDKIPEFYDANAGRVWIKDSEIKAVYDITNNVKAKKQVELILFNDILVAR